MSSFDGLKFKYGDYVHQTGEVYPARIEMRQERSDRGQRWATRYTMHIAGNLFPPTPESPFGPTQVGTKITEIDNAYLEDYKDFGFLYKNNTETPHYILNDGPNNLSGNQIIYRSWDHQTPSEFANTRSFSVGISALIAESYSGILFFSETISSAGTGGPVWKIYNSWNGTPYREQVSTQSMCQFFQEGIIVGLSGYPITPAPWWPDDEMTWRRRVIRATPRHHGHPNFDRPTHYVVRYRYEFQRFGPDPSQLPNTWHV